MCGIVGLYTSRESERERIRAQVQDIAACLRHRGPDDSGVWIGDTDPIGLGFSRLAILDLSPAGHQPMVSRDGRYAIVFNGEVFNFVELRAELEPHGISFRGQSDTEVILAAFTVWGIRDALQRFVGMFAIGVWDHHERCLTLVRDRLGIKPLHYWHDGRSFAFASELKALTRLPGFDRALDPAALDAYLRHLYVPAPMTIYRDVKKLLPGHFLTVDFRSPAVLEPIPYWSVDTTYAASSPFRGTDEDATAQLRTLLEDAVRLRMRSDVPMGALLSGGIDSTAIVAMMQHCSASPVNTFSIAFPGTAHDEAPYAARIASALGTRHTEMPVDANDALAVVPSLPDIFDEPFADPSLIPTYMVSRLARRDVTVTLTGDGADELFGGYERYVRGHRLLQRLEGIPVALRHAVAIGIGSLRPDTWDSLYQSTLGRVARNPSRLMGQKIAKAGLLASERDASAMYLSLMSPGWQDPSQLTGGRGMRSPVGERLQHYAHAPLVDRMMLVDQESYLADDLLAKVDRASMAVSLEARVPFLDHRVVEFAWSLRPDQKIRDGRGKWILREVLYQMVNRELVDRPKTGFTVPLAAWLRGPLASWARDHILIDDAPGVPPLFKQRLEREWNAFKEGDDRRALGLWTVAMFRAWQVRWLR